MKFPTLPRIPPPSDEVKAYSEWGAVGLVALGWITIAIYAGYAAVGKTSPIPIITQPPANQSLLNFDSATNRHSEGDF